jgi:hypothetical protein
MITKKQMKKERETTKREDCEEEEATRRSVGDY